jgi:hypothetical protein
MSFEGARAPGRLGKTVMTLRIIDAPDQLDAAFAQLEATLAAWAGGRADAWRQGHGRGVSYAKGMDVYLYVEAHEGAHIIGAALSERDRDVLRFETSRKEPARNRRSLVAAANTSGDMFLLFAIEALKAQGLRDVFRRLAGAAAIKRANLADRDYVLVGPLADPKTADALLALAALHPKVEDHIEKSAGRGQDEAEDSDLYAASRQVARQHRAPAKARRALFERLTGLGYVLETVELGALTADLAMSRGEDTVVFEIRAEAEVEDLQKALGHLSLIAPRALGIDRVLVLPAPAAAIGASLDPYKQAFEEMGVSLVFYDFKGGEIGFHLELADAALKSDVRLALL